jgi:hypothetical protein
MDLHGQEADDPHPSHARPGEAKMKGKRLQIKGIFLIIGRL